MNLIRIGICSPFKFPVFIQMSFTIIFIHICMFNGLSIVLYYYHWPGIMHLIICGLTKLVESYASRRNKFIHPIQKCIWWKKTHVSSNSKIEFVLFLKFSLFILTTSIVFHYLKNIVCLGNLTSAVMRQTF